MNRPWKVCLMGGDGSGWALDQDLITTRKTLEQLPELVQFTSMQDAEVVHSVWEEPLLAVPPSHLNGKRCLCHVCNDVPRTFENAFMLQARQIIGLWIGISRRACADLAALQLANTYVPYSLDPAVFHRAESAQAVATRRQLGIPENAYVIANFMRDSSGENLGLPKRQKAPELFAAIVAEARRAGVPVHVLLAGPRRHWLRARLTALGVPFTFVGQVTGQDDYAVNILSQAQIRDLYPAADLLLVTSRWEGGPRSILEAAATGAACLSTAVGLAADVLDPVCLFGSVDEAVQRIQEDVRSRVLRSTVDDQHRRFLELFTPSANVPRMRELYEKLESIKTTEFVSLQGKSSVELSPGPVRQALRRLRRMVRRATPGRGLTVGFWHEFFKPPYGGANQFMLALKKAMERQGVRVVSNRMTPWIDVHIGNSVWFDTRKFNRVARRGRLRLIHRVDGPIALYRGSDWEKDNQIYSLNEAYASATVYQSAWCFKKMLELGFKPINPVVIHNAVDDAIFNSRGRVAYDRGRKLKLISTAWSDNPRKGGPFLKSLEEKLDWSRVEFTFVGRTKETFQHIRHVPAQGSEALAGHLRQHDIYLMASQSESCSNALIEALACGLPALYLDDGGNGELTQFGGLSFTDEAGALAALERIAEHYESFQSCISVQSIDVIAKRYIELAARLMDAPV